VTIPTPIPPSHSVYYPTQTPLLYTPFNLSLHSPSTLLINYTLPHPVLTLESIHPHSTIYSPSFTLLLSTPSPHPLRALLHLNIDDKHLHPTVTFPIHSPMPSLPTPREYTRHSLQGYQYLHGHIDSTSAQLLLDYRHTANKLTPSSIPNVRLFDIFPISADPLTFCILTVPHTGPSPIVHCLSHNTSAMTSTPLPAQSFPLPSVHYVKCHPSTPPLPTLPCHFSTPSAHYLLHLNLSHPSAPTIPTQSVHSPPYPSLTLQSVYSPLGHLLTLSTPLDPTLPAGIYHYSTLHPHTHLSGMLSLPSPHLPTLSLPNNNTLLLSGIPTPLTYTLSVPLLPSPLPQSLLFTLPTSTVTIPVNPSPTPHPPSSKITLFLWILTAVLLTVLLSTAIVLSCKQSTHDDDTQAGESANTLHLSNNPDESMADNPDLSTDKL